MKKSFLKNIIKEEIRKLLYEGKMPPGINKDRDTADLDDWVEYQERYLGEDKAGDYFGIKTDKIDYDKMVDIAKGGEAKGKDLKKAVAGRMSKHIHKNHIIDKETGEPIDPDVLKSKIMERPESLIGRNEKMKASGGKQFVLYDTTLPAYKGLYVDESSPDKDLRMVSTCPSAGLCATFCYAAKGGYIQWENSGLSAARRLNFLLNDWEGFKKKMVSEINSKVKRQRGKYVVIRWHDAGDFFSPKYLDIAYEIARATPNSIHYAYTKEVSNVRKSNKPKNFTFNFSVGGKQDKIIDRNKEKYSDVVPFDVFADLTITGGKSKTTKIAKGNEDELKRRVAMVYKLNPSSVITYDELMKIPYSSEKNNKPFYNVLVWKGHGDDAAYRNDVLGTYLLIH